MACLNTQHLVQLCSNNQSEAVALKLIIVARIAYFAEELSMVYKLHILLDLCL